jgi:hypothetical protein
MKWFLILWTVGCLAAMNWLFPRHQTDDVSWLVGNAACALTFLLIGLGLFNAIGGILQKLRKVHP